MARKVDGNQRATEGHCHGVPGVGVLGTAVTQYQFGRSLAPYESRQAPAVTELHRLTPHPRRTWKGKAELSRVLVKHSELVISSVFSHSPDRNPRQSTRTEKWTRNRE